MAEISGYCTKCGTGWQADQNYCGSCGAALAAAGLSAATLASPGTGSGWTGARAAGVPNAPAETGFGAREATEPEPSDEARYPREAMVGAVLLTVFMPFIALIAALVLRAQEMRPSRREQLKNWAIASGAWLATGWVIGIIAFASALNAVGPSGCQGGINLSVPPSYFSSDGKHWTGTFTCMNGGTITKPVPASQVPGG
jgi:hypothetical protein